MKRIWRDSVLDALQRLAGPRNETVTRKQLIEQELSTIVTETQSIGETPEQTLSYELQGLREDGLVEFVARGRYKLTQPVLNAENFDGIDEELDLAIKQGRLRIGKIETASELALQRRRRGQERLRKLALENYDRTCALCDLRLESLLVTSHIVPWAQSEDARGDLRNVMILCRPHDCLFEIGQWSLDENLKVVRQPTAEEAWVIKLLLPEDLFFRHPHAYPPRVEYLQFHRTAHGLRPLRQ